MSDGFSPLIPGIAHAISDQEGGFNPMTFAATAAAGAAVGYAIPAAVSAAKSWVERVNGETEMGRGR